MRAALASLAAAVVLTAALGFGYPAFVTGISAVAFPDASTGSLVERDGRIVGSRLAAQAFAGKQYFHPRPSGTSPAYDAGATTFANLGPTNADLARNIRDAANAILALERPYVPGLTIGDIPVDAVTTSGSGIDPQVSPANARLQAARVAAVRGLPRSTVLELIDEATDSRSLGFLGEPGVNVLTLNLALDKETQG